MAYLTVDDKEVFREKGYVIKRDVVTLEQMAAARDVIWDHLPVDRNDPSTWVGKEGSQGMDGHAAFHALIYDSPLYSMVEELAGKGRLAPLHPPITSAEFAISTGW